MNDYSSLFTSGLMLLCESTPRSRQPSPAPSCANMRSFLSLDVAESLRTLATGSSSSSPTSSSRPSSRRTSVERKSVSSVASSSKLPITRSPTSPRRRSLPRPKPAPLAELPAAPVTLSNSSSPTIPAVKLATCSAPSQEPSVTLRRHLAPISSSLKLELSSDPTKPCSQFPTTPRSTRAFSMFSPLTPPPTDSVPWSSELGSADPWVEAFASALSPRTEAALGLHITSQLLPALGIVYEGENVAPALDERPVAPKRARGRRDRHSAPSRNPSMTANSTRSSQGSTTTSHRRVQRSGALARLEGRVQRSEWMSDEDEGVPVKSKSAFPPSVRNQLGIPRIEDQSFSFIDLSDDVVSLATRRDVRSFAA